MRNKKDHEIYDLSIPWGRDVPTVGMSLDNFNPPMIGTHKEHGRTLLEEGTPPGGLFYDEMISFFTHTGTHMDAPIHFKENAWSIDQIPLDRLYGEGVVLDIPKGELEEIGPRDLEEAEPNIKEGDIVIINTGWHDNFCGPVTDFDRAKYYASKNPGITKEGAEWLVNKKVKVVGVDFLGVDHPKYWYAGEGSWIVHQILLGNNIPMIQGMGGDLDKITGNRCIITCPPVKLVKGSAFPVRVLAIKESMS